MNATLQYKNAKTTMVRI